MKNISNKSLSQLKQKAIIGITQMTVREVVMKGISVIGQLTLVRILLPEYFGIFAILSFIVSIGELFTDLGLSMAIIQNKTSLSQKQLSTVFSIRLVLSLIVIVLLFLLSPIVREVYPALSYEHILMLQVTSLVLLFKPLRSVLVALLERELRYNQVSVIDLSGIVTYYVTAIILAFYGFGIWSFIAALFAKDACETLLALRYFPWIPKFFIDYLQVRNLLHVGMYFQMGSIMGFVHRSTIPVIAGMRATPQVVGYLDWGANVASIPRALSENVGRVSFSSFSRIQENKLLIARAIERSFDFLSFISLFLLLVAIGFGNEVVYYLLSESWVPAVPALIWFVGGTIFLNGTSSVGHGILALGKSKPLFLISLFVIPAEWILAYLLLSAYGFVGIAIASFIIAAVMLASQIVIAQRLGITLNLYRMFVIKAYIFFTGYGLILLLHHFLPGDGFFLTVIKLMFFSEGYLLVYFLIARHEVMQIADVSRKALFHRGS